MIHTCRHCKNQQHILESFKDLQMHCRVCNNKIEGINMTFKVGDKVEKVGGDYTFVGIVVAVFEKLSGVIRLVVEDDRGVLHVYSEKILRHVD